MLVKYWQQVQESAKKRGRSKEEDRTAGKGGVAAGAAAPHLQVRWIKAREREREATREREGVSVSLRMLRDPTRTQLTESLSEKQWLNTQGSSETTHPAKDFLDDDDDDNGTPTCCGPGAQRFSGL